MIVNKKPKHTRAERISRLKALYKEYGKGRRWTKIRAIYCIEEGVSLRVVNEYLNLLREAREID